MSKIQLRSRLAAVASLIPSGMRLCDVGTDHGFLPIKLILEGTVPSAIAMDLREGPLERAEEHRTLYHLEDRMDIRLSDGLEKIEPGEAECLSISGMGGLTIKGILTARQDVVRDLKAMVLQPQSDVDIVRRLVFELGFCIKDEKAVFDEGKYYFAMLCENCNLSEPEDNVNLTLNLEKRNLSKRVDKEHEKPENKIKEHEKLENIFGEYRFTKNGLKEPDEVQLMFGPVLLAEKNEILLSFLKKEKKTTENIIGKLKKADSTERNTVRMEEAEKYMALIRKALDYFC